EDGADPPPEDDSGGDSSAQPLQLLRRLLGEGPEGFDISDIGTVISDPEGLRQALDGFDGTPGNVTLTQTDDMLRYDVQVTDKTLSGTAGLDLEALGGVVNVQGTATLSADVTLHIILGADDNGFFIDPESNPDPEFTIGNFQITGDVS